jgi:hypothetical protein
MSKSAVRYIPKGGVWYTAPIYIRVGVKHKVTAAERERQANPLIISEPIPEWDVKPLECPGRTTRDGIQPCYDGFEAGIMVPYYNRTLSQCLVRLPTEPRSLPYGWTQVSEDDAQAFAEAAVQDKAELLGMAPIIGRGLDTE